MSARLPRTPHHVSLPAEEWRPIPGYEDTFWVSNTGRVYSIPRERTPGGVLRGSIDQAGYLYYRLSRRGADPFVRAHTLVALAFIGPRPDGADVVRHLDDDKSNNHVSNLAYGTFQDNSDDKRRNSGWSSERECVVCGERWTPTTRTAARTCGRVCAAAFRKLPTHKARGERASGAKLTEQQVRQIRHRATTAGRGVFGTYAALGREYGVSSNSIRRIVLRRTWTHLPDDDCDEIAREEEAERVADDWRDGDA